MAEALPAVARVIGWGVRGMLTWLKHSTARTHVWVHRPGLSDSSYQGVAGGAIVLCGSSGAERVCSP